MTLGSTLETLATLGDESRLRLCLLLEDRELNVSDLVRVTGIAQSRVSTHLGRLRDAGLVRDRKQGAQCFYTLSPDALSKAAASVLGEARALEDPTLLGDRERLAALEAQRREGAQLSDDDVERFHYSPGRTWRSLAAGLSGLLDLGDVLDIGTGDGAAAAMIAPFCRSLTCVDLSERVVAAASERFEGAPHVRAQRADAEALPFADASFDTALLFHTLTYTERPARALAECARVLRPNGRVVVLCLDAHRHEELTARYGERHHGLSPTQLRRLLAGAKLDIRTCEIACREPKKPHFRVVLAVAHKAAEATSERAPVRRVPRKNRSKS